MNLEHFLQDYHDRTSDVEDTSFRLFAARLRDWFALIDSTPEVRAILGPLEQAIDFSAWYQKGIDSRRGMVGSGRLEWAEDRTERLGQSLALFRHLASGEMEFAQFCTGFLWAGSNFDDMVFKIRDELFRPLARDVERFIERTLSPSEPSGMAPAADRIVHLDHNSQPYREAIGALRALKAAVRGVNDEIPSEDRQRILAEIEATERLLEAPAARSGAVLPLIMPSLKWLGDHLAGALISVAVGAALAALVALFR